MTKNPPKRTFRKKNKMYIPKTLYCPYCGGKAILRPVSYLFGDDVNPGSSTHYYVCNKYPECDAYIACYHGNFEPKGRIADSWLRHRRNVAHRYIKLIVENHIMLQRNVYPTIASRLGVRLEEAQPVPEQAVSEEAVSEEAVVAEEGFDDVADYFDDDDDLYNEPEDIYAAQNYTSDYEEYEEDEEEEHYVREGSAAETAKKVFSAIGRGLVTFFTAGGRGIAFVAVHIKYFCINHCILPP